MNTKTYFQNNNSAIVISFLAVVSFVYIILFEFILPANGILPKPSILIESVASLYKHYDFLAAYAFTTSIIYFAMFAGYYLIKIFRNLILYFTEDFANIINLLVINKYFLTISTVFIFYFWFGNVFYGELILAIFLVVGNLKIQYFEDFYKVKKEYLDAARSLKISDDKKNSIIWKSIQPGLFTSLNSSHFSLWTILIIYEYVNGTNGIGSIFRLSIKYNDFSIVVLLVIIISITLWLSILLLNIIKKKFFFWEN